MSKTIGKRKHLCGKADAWRYSLKGEGGVGRAGAGVERRWTEVVREMEVVGKKVGGSRNKKKTKRNKTRWKKKS